MKKEKELLQRYGTTRILLDSVQKTIDNPDNSVTDNLAAGNKVSRQMSVKLAEQGALASEATLLAIGGGALVVTNLATVGMVTAGVAGLLSGPLVLGSGVAILALRAVSQILKRTALISARKKIEKEDKPQKVKKVRGKRALEEKIALLQEIIIKQQAIIDKLMAEDKEKTRRIKNLEEALEIVKVAHKCVENDFQEAA